ncbi:phosphate ABC transporter substrate-binding protein PstS [Microlunatus ginsengisoli]|uniref:Phosphate-binding protein n=1 Tax=Microlunatus ginsengisoli TaxID=363863 RepID=A0ABP6ZHQ0_9ACTN
MITNRLVAGRLVAASAAVSLAAFGLAACGSDPAGTTTTTGDGSASASGLACPSGKLTGEGSTAQANAMQEVIADYGDACGNKSTIEYNPTGSGAGIKSFYGGLVDFAGSDSALKTVAVDGVVEADKAKERCGGNQAWNLPMVVGPIAFAYNLEGVDKLILTPEVLSDIFTGKITTWNDPAIAKLNPGTTLPSSKISVFFRSDESGTTENVEKFLKAAGNGAWTAEPSKKWAGTGEGKNKSSGVADGVKGTPGSISYMEWSYAKDNNLPTVQLDNGQGATELTADSVSKALSGAEVKGSGNDLALSLKYTDTEAGAYPALLVTYEIVCSKGLDAEKTAVLKDFLTYFSSSDTQGKLVELGYAPLPSSLQSKVAASVQAIQ